MFPLIAVLAQASGVILDKVILTRRRVAVHVFVPVLFLFLFVITALFYPFLGKVSPEFFQAKNLLLFAAMIVVAVIWNYFYYKAIQEEKVQESELILIFQPLLTIVLAAIFLKSENNFRIEIAAIIAAIALIAAQIRKHHLQFSGATVSMIIAIIFMSIELIIIRIVLNFLSPVALYAIRTGIVFLVFYLYFRPRLFQVSRTNILLILGNAALSSVQMITKFYGFEVYGVIYTSLILILSPVLVYIASSLFLHEKIRPRVVISSVVILACIVYATIFN